MAHILIADGDEAAASEASNILINAGHASGWIGDIGKIFELLKWRVPDVILLDWDKHESSGSTILKRLQKSPKHRKVPVIFLSSDSEDECAKQVRSAGVADYLCKPIEPKLLVWRVDQLLKFHARRT